MDLIEAWQTWRRRWRFIAATTAGIPALVLAIGVWLPPAYEARGSLLVEQIPREAQLLGKISEALGTTTDNERLSEIRGNHLTLLTSAPVLESVIRELSLPVSPTTFLKTFPVKARYVLKTDVLLLSLRHRDPELAARVLESLMRNYIRQSVTTKSRTLEEANRFIDARIAELQAQLGADEAELSKHQAAHGMLDAAEHGRLALMQADRLEIDARTLEGELAAVSKQRQEITRQLYSEVKSETLAALRPEYTQLNALKLQQAGIESRLAATRQSLGKLRTRIASLPTERLAIERIMRRLDANRKLHATLTERRHELGILSALHAAPVSVIESPPIPESPVFPNLPLGVAVGSVLGLFLGMTGAIAREQIERHVHAPDVVAEVIAAPVLGAVPEIPGSGKLPISDGGPGFADAFLAVAHSRCFEERRMLVVTSPEPSDGKSTVATNLAIALSRLGRRTLLVDADLRRPTLHRVLDAPLRDDDPLIEAVWKGLLEGDEAAIAQCTEIGNVHGLSEWLAGRIRLEDAIVPSGMRHLDLMLSGRESIHPLALLALPRVPQALSQLANRYDAVILDAPPINLFADALTLAKQTDGLLLVSSYGTTLASLEEASRRIERAEVPVIGSLLNKAVRPRRYSYPSRTV